MQRKVTQASRVVPHFICLGLNHPVLRQIKTFRDWVSNLHSSRILSFVFDLRRPHVAERLARQCGSPR